MRASVISILLVLCQSGILLADDSGQPYNPQWVILPFVSYTPETSVMFGGMGMYQFKPGRAETESRSSHMIVSGTYTLNRQLMLEFTPNVIFDQERLILDGRYEYSFFPENYWGVGPGAPDNAETSIEYRKFDFYQTILFKSGPDLHIGPKLRWSRLYDISIAEDLSQPTGGPSEHEISEGSTLAGIGFSVRNDRRNSLITPTENHYLEITGMLYPEFSGTTHPHTSWLIDARRYLALRGDQTSVLAFHFRSRFTTGNPPFQEYALLGGREIMRGYYEGRFRDFNAAQIQAEFRQHIHGRFGLTLFAAAGEAWGRFVEITFSNPKYSAGAGVRFNLNPDDTNNLRIDYGIGPHGGGLYITIGEAF